MTHLGQESSEEVWEDRGPEILLRCSLSWPVVFVRMQNVRREAEWVQWSLQREICVRDLLALAPSGFGQEPAGLQPQR